MARTHSVVLLRFVVLHAGCFCYAVCGATMFGRKQGDVVHLPDTSARGRLDTGFPQCDGPAIDPQAYPPRFAAAFQQVCLQKPQAI